MGKIVHFVLWKLTEPDASADPAAHYSAISEPFQKLLNVPGVLTVHVGPPKSADRAKGFDVGFYGVFESAESLQKYIASDEHMTIVINDIRPVMRDVLVWDIELPDES